MYVLVASLYVGSRASFLVSTARLRPVICYTTKHKEAAHAQTETYTHAHIHTHTTVTLKFTFSSTCSQMPLLFCREPTEEELSAANKIQKAVKKHLDHQITKCLNIGTTHSTLVTHITAHTTGSPQHTWMMEEKTKSVELIAPHSEQLGKLIFR